MTIGFLRGCLLLPFLVFCLVSNLSFVRGVQASVQDGVYDADGKHWTILMEPEKKSCSMVIHFDEDTMAYIGEDDWTDDVLLYFIFMKKGVNFRKGETHNVEIGFGKGLIWRVQAPGTVVDNYGGVYVRALDGEFGVHFSRRGAFSMTIDGKDYGTYELAEADKGMLRLLKCESDFDEGIIPAR